MTKILSSVNLNTVKLAFIDFILDTVLKDKIVYLGDKMLAKVNLSDIQYHSLVSLIVLSMEQKIPVKFQDFPPLTHDLTVIVKSVYLEGQKLIIYLTPKHGVRVKKPQKQCRAARTKLKRIYPYNLFDQEDVFVIVADD